MYVCMWACMRVGVYLSTINRRTLDWNDLKLSTLVVPDTLSKPSDFGFKRARGHRHMIHTFFDCRRTHNEEMLPLLIFIHAKDVVRRWGLASPHSALAFWFFLWPSGIIVCCSITFYLFTADGPESRRPARAGDSQNVQNGSEAVQPAGEGVDGQIREVIEKLSSWSGLTDSLPTLPLYSF